jgi:hypothetical protein
MDNVQRNVLRTIKKNEIEQKIFSFTNISCQANVRLYYDIITNWMCFTELAIPALKPAGTKRREISEGGR